nr:transposase [Streptomyces sp. CB01881]
MDRRAYPSDLSDERWALIEPMITAWKQDRVSRLATGDPGSCDLREIVNAIFHQNRTGCQWRYPPHDLPSRSAVFYYFGLWRQDGPDQRIQELLRRQVRERARRSGDPSLVIIDTRSVRAAAGVPKTTTGPDANKKVSGRKQGLAVDVMGLIIGVVVPAASAHDNAAGTVLPDQVAERCGIVQFRAARGDPLQHIGIHHEPERRSRADRDGPESAKTPLPDDLHGRLPPATSTSTPESRHASLSDQHVRRWRPLSN